MDNITIIIPTCPRPSHPSIKIIDQTIDSIVWQLNKSRIIVTCDGPAGAPAYEEFKVNLARRYPNIEIISFDERGHQIGNLGAVLPLITTPLIFYLEDDWQILPRIEWKELSDLILAGEFNCIKLHSQPRIHPMHEHMMFERVHYGETYLIKTTQFSSNPNLGSTDWYRQVYDRYLKDKISFIEWELHGPAGQAPWSDFKLGVYNPCHGDMYRCLHLDGKNRT